MAAVVMMEEERRRAERAAKEKERLYNEARETWSARMSDQQARQHHNPWTKFDYTSIDYHSSPYAAAADVEPVQWRPNRGGGERDRELELVSTAYYRELRERPSEPYYI